MAHAAKEIDFHDNKGTYSGTDSGDRRWQITAVYAGWRLEFRDPGDVTATYAGTHRTLAAAKAEAAR
ncbi:MAG: hypothetical protein ACXVEU_18000 [Nocardioidaceae bacterium]